jgi:rhomboid protease GluP
MEQRISYYLGQNGYLKMLTTLSEFTIFFKKEHGFVSVIELVNMDKNPYVTEDAVYNVAQKAQWRFLDQGCEEVHDLVLVITSEPQRAIPLGERKRAFWIIDTSENQLFIPDGKAEDFYGLKEMIGQWLTADFDSVVQEDAVYQANGRRIISVKEQPLVNHGIFLINLLVFTFCTLSGDVLYNYGRLSLQETLNGQWYRIFTSMFLHGDMMHLAGNMIVLFFLGNIVEKELGHIKYFILYFISGIAGAMASLWMQSVRIMYGEEITGSIGASGAIFGMMGCLLWILMRNKGQLEQMSFIRVLFLVCYTLYSGLITPYVDNAAHVGGLVAGFFMAIVLYRKNKKPKEREGNR